MKTNKFLIIVLLSFIFCSADTICAAGGNAGNKAKVLIIGMDENIKSNYYHPLMIAEETQIERDSVGAVYNAIISDNIIESGLDKCLFLYLDYSQTSNQPFNKIIIKGDAEKTYADLSDVSNESYTHIMNENEANYLLIINRHYLKDQEKPMHTIFHMVSYSLYDISKKEMMSGCKYYTSLKLEKPEEVKKKSKKLCARIVSEIKDKIGG